MNVTHIVPALGEKSGGPSRSVYNLVVGLRDKGCNAEICALNDKRNPNIAHETWIHETEGPQTDFFAICFPFKANVRQNIGDIVHVHSIYSHPTMVGPAVAREKGVPYIIAPRGSLYANALRKSSLKKLLFNKLFLWRDIKGAAVIHATCKEEYRQIRACGIDRPVAIIPNSISCPLELSEITPKNKIRVGFLGRLNPIKNIDGLIRSWSKAGLGKRNDLELVIIGGANHDYEREYLTSLHDLELELGIANIVWEGALYGEEKDKVMHTLSYSILPSHSENFGMSVIESLLLGIPVIASDKTPWEELNDNKCGWWVPNTDESLADALTKAVSIPQDEWVEMGKRGQQMVVNGYSVDAVSGDLICLYNWVLGKCEKPSFVFID